jgi:predicted small integral membrane protein
LLQGKPRQLLNTAQPADPVLEAPFAYFFMALFIILFFGMTTWELVRTARQPAKHHLAAQ